MFPAVCFYFRLCFAISFSFSLRKQAQRKYWKILCQDGFDQIFFSHFLFASNLKLSFSFHFIHKSSEKKIWFPVTWSRKQKNDHEWPWTRLLQILLRFVVGGAYVVVGGIFVWSGLNSIITQWDERLWNSIIAMGIVECFHTLCVSPSTPTHVRRSDWGTTFHPNPHAY